MNRILRPTAVLIGGEWHTGLEVALNGKEIEAIRPAQGPGDGTILSPAFVNAHSHLEYRLLAETMVDMPYAQWMGQIIRAKMAEPLEQAQRACEIAARDNHTTGVAWIVEHSDRPFSSAAMAGVGLEGVVLQEVITFREREDPREKLALIRDKASSQNARLTPHAPHTVDDRTLASWADGGFFSIHVLETADENELCEFGTGPLADAYRPFGIEYPARHKRVIDFLDGLGLVRSGAQFVHCCAITEPEIARLAQAGVSVAHCPRSNQALDCPHAPVREMLDAGVKIGLGLDSAASSGPIDMFAEMRAADHTGLMRGKPLSAPEIWRMATTMGAESVGLSGWDIAEGARVPLIAIRPPAPCKNLDELLQIATPEHVEWV